MAKSVWQQKAPAAPLAVDILFGNAVASPWHAGKLGGHPSASGLPQYVSSRAPHAPHHAPRSKYYAFARTHEQGPGRPKAHSTETWNELQTAGNSPSTAGGSGVQSGQVGPVRKLGLTTLHQMHQPALDGHRRRSRTHRRHRRGRDLSREAKAYHCLPQRTWHGHRRMAPSPSPGSRRVATWATVGVNSLRVRAQKQLCRWISTHSSIRVTAADGISE